MLIFLSLSARLCIYYVTFSSLRFSLGSVNFSVSFSYFTKKRFPDFPHSGDIVAETVHLQEGLLPQFSHAIEPHLRKLGLPTRLQRGIPELIKEHTVCKKGDTLTPEQASILVSVGGSFVKDE